MAADQLQDQFKTSTPDSDSKFSTVLIIWDVQHGPSSIVELV